MIREFGSVGIYNKYYHTDEKQLSKMGV